MTRKIISRKRDIKDKAERDRVGDILFPGPHKRRRSADDYNEGDIVGTSQSCTVLTEPHDLMVVEAETSLTCDPLSSANADREGDGATMMKDISAVVEVLSTTMSSESFEVKTHLKSSITHLHTGLL